MAYRSKVRTCLWFESGGLEAAEFYVSLLPWSAIDAVYPHGNPDDPMIVEFTLHGSPMMIRVGCANLNSWDKWIFRATAA